MFLNPSPIAMMHAPFLRKTVAPVRPGGASCVPLAPRTCAYV
jgi:hypothetical protein